MFKVGSRNYPSFKQHPYHTACIAMKTDTHTHMYIYIYALGLAVNIHMSNSETNYIYIYIHHTCERVFIHIVTVLIFRCTWNH